MTDRQTDRQTDGRTDGRTDARGKTICLPTLSGGDIIRRLQSLSILPPKIDVICKITTKLANNRGYFGIPKHSSRRYGSACLCLVHGMLCLNIIHVETENSQTTE